MATEISFSDSTTLAIHLTYMSKNTLFAIIIPNNEDRRIFHQFIECNNDTGSVGHTSITSPLFPRNAYLVKKTCDGCNKTVTLSHNSTTPFDNGFYGFCERCETVIIHDPANKDSSAHVWHRHNIVIIGNYLKGHTTPPEEKTYGYQIRLSSLPINEIIANNRMFKIDAPTMMYNKKDLEDYIDQQLSTIVEPPYDSQDEHQNDIVFDTELLPLTVEI